MGARSAIVDVFDKLFFNFSYGGKIRPLYPSRRFFHIIFPPYPLVPPTFPYFPPPTRFVLRGACRVLSVPDYPINLRVLNKSIGEIASNRIFVEPMSIPWEKSEMFSRRSSKTPDKLTAKSTSAPDGANCCMNGGVFRNCRVYSESLVF